MPSALYYNVKDYGAIGNGTTDDTSAIQTAMDATPSAASLFFPAGTYKTTARLTRDDADGPINLIGAGSESGGAIIKQTTANTDCLGFDVDVLTTYSATGSDNNRNYDRASTVSHLRIEGPTGGTAGAGIYGLSDVNLFDVSIYGFDTGYFIDSKAYFTRAIGCKFATATGEGALFYGYNGTFLNCEFWNSAYGLYASGNQNVRVRDCVFEQNSSAGLVYDGALRSPLTSTPASFVISGCYFEETATAVPDISLGPTTAVADVIIDGSIFIQNAQGDTGASWHILMDKVDRVTISTNRLYGGGTGGGDIKGSANTTNVVLINQEYDTVSFVGTPTTLP